MKIIGISGTNGSGKDLLSHVLGEKYGYFVASATDMLEAELKIRGWESNRQNKSKLSAEWRREYGLGVIVDRAVRAAKAAGFDKVIVGSLRNSGEADKVHELEGIVLWIDADPKVRYERIRQADRNRNEDNRTYEQFLAEEQAEMTHSGDAATLNMSDVKARADIHLDNSGDDIEAFKIQAELTLNNFLITNSTQNNKA